MMARAFDPSARASFATALATETLVPGARIPNDRAFLAVAASFRRHGGLVGGDEIAERLRRLHGAALSSLARRIVAREVICFEWHGERWLPLLQFDLTDMSLRPVLVRVSAELAEVFDGWELCRWLATPNSSLGHRTPLDVLDDDEGAVLRAARLARFVACG